MGSKKVLVALPDDLWQRMTDQIKDDGKDSDLTPGEIIRRALMEYYELPLPDIRNGEKILKHGGMRSGVGRPKKKLKGVPSTSR